MWQKNGKGPKYKSGYLRDQNNERIMVMVRILKNGKPEIKTGESWQMFKAAGWKKVS